MEPLSVTGATFYNKDNAERHHTDKYELVNDVAAPILRRGGSFHLGLRFNRSYDQERDVIRISFTFGENPKIGDGTKAVRQVKPHVKEFSKNPSQWDVLLNRHDDTTIILEIKIPAHVQVGIWKGNIITTVDSYAGPRNEYKIPDDIYVIFNPWSPEDAVYMESEEEREEYILNDTGKIWCGTFKNPKGKVWMFGQFEDISLPAAVFLLEKSRLVAAHRGSAIMVSRAISSMVNAVDDDGLLEGRWDGNYSDGTSPFAWTGSAPILDQYLMTGGNPVKYGQCWVFAAAVVTICRTLGIPCRATTNYISGHDTNASMTVDKYFDVFGNKIENGPDGTCSDSCWNFHVWNDVWMKRPDLPRGYDGWQIIDATPQEASDQVMRCGPASVEAVKKGEVWYSYDTPFVFSEVNADIVHFQEDEGSEWQFVKSSVNKYHVGRMILTKKLGPTDAKTDSDMEDVTSVYKFKEGSEEERRAVINAVRGRYIPEESYETPDQKSDVEFDLVDIETVPLGQNFVVELSMENRAEEIRTINAVLSASAGDYRGSSTKEIKAWRETFVVEPGQHEIKQLMITPEDYLDKLIDHGFIKIYSVVKVIETNQRWSEEDDFTFTMPEVIIDVPEPFKVGQSSAVIFSFTNPLDTPLTNCSYAAGGPGKQKPKSVEYRDIEPKETITIVKNFTGKKPGEKEIVFNFTSKQIKDIHNSSTVVVAE